MTPADDDIVKVTFDLPRNLRDAIQSRAAQEDRSMAATIRRACSHYIGAVASEELTGGEG